MSDGRDKPGAIIGAALASLLLAAALGAGAAFFLYAAFNTADVLTNGGRRAPTAGGMTVGLMGIVGVVLGLASLAFVVVGVWTIWGGFKKAGQKAARTEEDEAYWKSFPVPKD